MWYRLCLQLASLYNPVDKRVTERVKKMLLLGVTQWSEMRRHLSVFVSENFPDVSELDASFYPSDHALSSLMYRANDPSQADAYRPGARVETCKVQLAKYINFGFGDRELFLNRVLLIVCKLTLG